jgi:hypothetical protein
LARTDRQSRMLAGLSLAVLERSRCLKTVKGG